MLAPYHIALMLGALVGGFAAFGFGLYFGSRLRGGLHTRYTIPLGLGMTGAVAAYLAVFFFW